MHWTAITEFLRVVTIGVLLLQGIVILKQYRRQQYGWMLAGFCGAVIAYLLIDMPGRFPLPARVILLAGAFSIPFGIWLIARALFEDHFSPGRRHLLILFTILLINFTLFFIRPAAAPGSVIFVLSGFLSQAISLFFILWAAFIAYSGRQDDLIEERLRLRKSFILLSTIMIGLTLLAEVVLFRSESPELLEFLQKSGIFALTYYFAIANLKFNAGFFLPEATKPPMVESPPAELLQKLNELLEKEHVYREEGLTIGRLAEKLGEKEYKVRRLINRHLGFRNFNDFLNQYRIQEACEILLDPERSDFTVLEISYEVGYQSLGPFNAAFKRLTGMTPTAYRKANR